MTESKLKQIIESYNYKKIGPMKFENLLIRDETSEIMNRLLNLVQNKNLPRIVDNIFDRANSYSSKNLNNLETKVSKLMKEN